MAADQRGRACPGSTRTPRGAVGALLTILLSACVTPLPPILPPPAAGFSPRDSTGLAYETGRRDAQILHRPRSAAVVAALALPLGMAAHRATGEYWATPTVASGVTIGAAIWSRREKGRALPTVPDSMRVRYGLADPFLWLQYERGYRDEIALARRGEAERSTRTALLVTLLTGLTFYAFRPSN